MDIKEYKIPVPWGHVAVKTFGQNEDDPIFAIHGLLDNAGTFDRLIPLLPSNFFYICIDLPGHGHSSHFPAGLPVYITNFIYTCKLVLDFYNIQKYIVLGHSIGGVIGLYLAHIYPKTVKKMVMLDLVYFIPVLSSGLAETMYHNLDSLRQLQKRLDSDNQNKVYTYDEALDKLIKCKVLGDVNRMAAKALLSRALTPVGENEFKFTWDQRNKFIFSPLHDYEYVAKFLEKNPLQCQLLMILGKESEDLHNVAGLVLDQLKNNKNCTIKYVPGGHYVHNNTPEMVAPILLKFLTYEKSKM